MVVRLYEDLRHAALYVRYRPTTPRPLLQLLSQRAGQQLQLAVDVGCGSGQATQLLAEWFQRVLGTDISPAQIKEANRDAAMRRGDTNALGDAGAKSKTTLQEIKASEEKGTSSDTCPGADSKIQFAVSPAEVIPAEPNSVQLLMTVQAAHWFNLTEFFAEARRVLSPGGVLALVGYKLPMAIHNGVAYPQIRELLADRYVNGLCDWIQRGSKEVYIENYSNSRFQSPLSDHHREEGIFCDLKGTVKDLLGYCSTWSGFQKMAQEKGEEAAELYLQDLKKAILGVLGNGVEEKTPIVMRFEYFALISRKGH